MMMGGRTALSVLVAALSMTGCSTSARELPVRTKYSATTAFHEWKTFRFATVEPKTPVGAQYPRYEQMIRQALVDELTSRGYTRIEDGTPDFRVAYELLFRGDTSPKSVPQGGGAEPMARSYGGSTPAGSLTISMLDPATSENLWTGSLAEFKITAVEPQKQLDSAVWRVLAEFPPITH
jgi:hypothetical protein